MFSTTSFKVRGDDSTRLIGRSSEHFSVTAKMFLSINGTDSLNCCGGVSLLIGPRDAHVASPLFEPTSKLLRALGALLSCVIVSWNRIRKVSVSRTICVALQTGSKAWLRLPSEESPLLERQRAGALLYAKNIRAQSSRQISGPGSSLRRDGRKVERVRGLNRKARDTQPDLREATGVRD